LKFISIANAKGGVGKTTTAVNMSAGLATLGKKVLLIDLDYQANATFACLERNAEAPTIADVLINDVNIKEAILPVSKNLDLLPSNIDLIGADTKLSSQPGRDLVLSVALEGLDENSYDYVIADLPPNVGVMALNGMGASDLVIIPIQMEFYAMKSVNIIIDLIKAVKARLNRRLAISGALATMFDSRNIICNTCLQEMRESFKDLAFNTAIRSNVSLAVAPARGMNIFKHEPKSHGAQDYLDFCKEFLRREGDQINVK